MILRRAVLLLLVLAAATSSCAYYNTFYLARRTYDRSLNGLPYAVDKTDLQQGALFTKTIEYSRKVRERYPKSKWVDDAYLLEARAEMANDDPRQAVKMLEDFDTLYPKSPLHDESRFYLGVALRQSRKHERALRALDEFLARQPKHSLVPYAQLEKSRALMSLDRPAEAAEAASLALARWKKGPMSVRARIARAEALLASKQYGPARDDFRYLGTRADTDEDRLVYLLRESECLEVGQRYDEALALLRDAIAHEHEPTLSDTTGGRQATVNTAMPGYDRYGRLLVRIGSVQLRAGRTDEAMTAFRRVVELYPRTGLAAEGQYRLGYAYETALDDFDKAREEYAKVQGMGAGTTFTDQAVQRAGSLERLASFRSAGGADTLQHKADTQFLIAEQYLFQLDKPERALEEYQRIEKEFAGTPYEAKAILAQGWVLSRKLARPAGGDSLFWNVVHNHAGTESQLAARDYLELEGIPVPADLIRLPEPPVARVDTSFTAPAVEDTTPMTELPRIPSDTLRIGPQTPITPGDLAGPGSPPPPGIRYDSTPPPSLRTPQGPLVTPPPVATQPPPAEPARRDTVARGGSSTQPPTPRAPSPGPESVQPQPPPPPQPAPPDTSGAR